MDDAQLLESFEVLALAAGPVVMQAFLQGCDVERKGDDSPVTIADRESERIIVEALRRICPGMPIVAEEAASAGDCPTDPGPEFLLVDPLDGTREFVEGRPEFTVNIALVRNGAPVIGVVYAPAARLLFSGRPGAASKAVVDDDFAIVSRQPVKVRARPMTPVVVASRSHRSTETDNYVATLGQVEFTSIGSSLKFGLLAGGEADIYPRFGRTMQWDTAAGDAVLRAAGGTTTTIEGEPLSYGPRRGESELPYENPSFIACGG
jgi:3'(2'), 5'-bisphosphate nucleotidase